MSKLFLHNLRTASLYNNPLCIKSLRARLRMKHLLSWGTVTLTITAFVCLLVYLTPTERDMVTSADAARMMILPLIIIQGIILMLLGTGSVASGIALERESELLNYHRISPMSPVSKILGYLFGLPAREYFLFGLTLPFLAFAVYISKFSLLTLLHFYAVFFTSVWVYHMTGLVVGMSWSKPRRIAMITQGLVVVLYLFLPQLSYVGLTFFDYLTVRPTLYSMVFDEINKAMPNSNYFAGTLLSDIERYRDVGFFNLAIHPTVYSLIMQGFILVSMFVVVYRKWCDEDNHPFSKLYALIFYSGTMLLVVGSIWPFLSQYRFYEQLSQRLPQIPTMGILYMLIISSMAICGIVGVFVIHIVTPSRYTALKGIRRARKNGKTKLPINSDAVSSLPLVIAMIILTCAGCVVLMWRAYVSNQFFTSLNSIAACILPLVYFAAVMLFIQGIRERYSSRVFVIVLFLLWMIPAFTTMIMFSAKDAWVPGTYVSLLCAPASMVYIIDNALRQLDQVFAFGHGFHIIPEPVYAHISNISYISVGFYSVLAIAVQVNLWIWKRRLFTIDSVELAGKK